MFLARTKYTNPTYICNKCGIRMTYKPKRLCLQEYKPRYGHKTVEFYDLCNKCYPIFNNWIKNTRQN